jgi:DNA-binding transcriptional MerR regulator
MSKLLKAGELAKKADVLVSTIRFYTKEGLLKAAAYSPGKYNLYNEFDSLESLKKIKILQKKRYTLEEIKERLSSNGLKK